jgi:hypothetical protein
MDKIVGSWLKEKTSERLAEKGGIVKKRKENKNKVTINTLKFRGLHLDPARRHLELNTVLRIIDRAAKCKINVLHLHLTDDQGIAFESKFFAGGWTIKEQEIIYEACRKHGIEIVPEIDIPGHTVALRSILHDGVYKPEKKMGLISDGLINLGDMPRILELYDEVAQRFRVKYFHMGGDETRGASKEFIQEVVDRVCNWGRSRDIQIIAWEDVLGKVEPPENLLIQKWRSYAPWTAQKLEEIGNGRIIFSNNYYIDTCIDPFTAYRAKIPEGALGCTACTWGELIGNENIESSIFPTLYLLGHRWYNLDEKTPPSVLLYILCCSNGWILEGTQDTWKRRQWKAFVLKKTDVPVRSSSSTTKDTKLDRPEDNYPLISKFLVRMAYAFHQLMIGNEIFDIESYQLAMIDAGATPEYVQLITNGLNRTTFHQVLRKIRGSLEVEEQNLYKNGIRMVIRESLRFK